MVFTLLSNGNSDNHTALEKFMQKKPYEQNTSAQMGHSNINISRFVQGQKPYSLLKYQETYIAASNKLIEFFTLHNMKKYIDFEKKSKFQKELMEQILKQLRQFLRKKALRQFELMMGKDAGQQGLKLEEKFEAFDQIFFRSFILERLKKNDPERIQCSPFETYDIEDEILNQLESALARAYAQLL